MNNLTGDRSVTLSGPPALLWPAAAFLAVTAIVTIIRAATYFESGIWLIAFLLLVGVVAQILLALGQAALRPEGTASGRILTEAWLWNLGTVLVPLGTLTDGKAGVVIGSLLLLAALVLFARSALEATSGAQPLWSLYWVFILFMAVSVLTGIGLSWSDSWF